MRGSSIYAGPWQAIATVVGLFTLAGTLRGQVITGTLTDIQHAPYADIAAQFHVDNFAAAGVSMFGGEVVMFCTDLSARSLDEDGLSFPHVLTSGNSNLTLGNSSQLKVWGRYSDTQDEGLALSMAMWLVDNYYDSYFQHAPAADANERQYAFQNVLWEIFGDGATANGLDFGGGNINRSRFGPGGGTEAALLWGHMTFLLDEVANSGVTSTYTATTNAAFTIDDRIDHQDYLVLGYSPTPEPSALVLGALGIGLGLRRRR